ncbi:MAG TPA: hypothetical protein VL095_10435 [Flavisolibacter sp.]|nr:hypothetical protein [Flavisolibacter sp.]
MKQNALLQQDRIEEACAGTGCLTCCDCKVINMEERRQEVKSPSLQLYAKEAEHYFFYYDVNPQQV